MNIIDWNACTPEQQQAALARPALQRHDDLAATVAAIIADVRRDGDAALRRYGARFDGCTLDRFEVDAAAFAAAERQVGDALRAAMVAAIARIEAFHRAGAPQPYAVDTALGVRCERIVRPIGRVGLYVPAGSAPLPSTVLMLAVPARLAGCDDIVLCTPPRPDGRADPAVLVAASLCGVRRVFVLGGAQAIAAMALGSDSVPRCDKLFGPGNAWVTEAKLQLSVDPDGAAIDLPAGPSEVLVIADAGADAELVAADLLSQAEHGPDSQVMLMSDDDRLLADVADAMQRQLAELPRRAIAAAALAHARLIRVADIGQAVALSNRYAPEHLIIATADPRAWLPQVRAAGSVFLGRWSPEALGDYCSGTNHVLPTYGAARACSGVSVASFCTQITVQQVDADGLRAIGPDAATLARAEQLIGHERAVTRRLERLETVL